MVNAREIAYTPNGTKELNRDAISLVIGFVKNSVDLDIQGLVQRVAGELQLQRVKGLQYYNKVSSVLGGDSSKFEDCIFAARFFVARYIFDNSSCDDGMVFTFLAGGLSYNPFSYHSHLESTAAFIHKNTGVSEPIKNWEKAQEVFARRVIDYATELEKIAIAEETSLEQA